VVPSSILKTGTSGNIYSKINTWQIKNYDNNGNRRIFPYITQTTETDALGIYKTTTNTNNDADLEYGNVTTQNINYNGQARETTLYTYVSAGTWSGCMNKVLTKTIEKRRTGEIYMTTWGLRTIDYTYDATTGKLLSEIYDKNDANQITIGYNQFDGFGNVLSKTISGRGFANRTIGTLYDSKGRFITTVTNALSQTSNVFDYDYGLGVATKSTDINGLTTTYKYDGFGKLTQITNPNGIVVNKTYNWVTGSGVPNAWYYITKTTTGNPDTTVYFDIYNRILRMSTYSDVGGNTVFNVDTVYNNKKQIESTSFTAPNGNTINSTYSFYPNGLLQSIQSPINPITIAYSGGTRYITKTVDGIPRTKSITTDAVGNITNIVDELGGTITKSYNCGNYLRETNVNGVVTTYNTNKQGHKINIAEPNMGAVAYEYNALGEMTKSTDAKGNIYNYTYDNLADDFGIRVAEIVRGVTEVRTHDENGKILETWYERKQEYLKNLREAGQESLLVCAADTTHNLQSLLVTHVLIGNSVWGSFHASIEEKMNFYENVIDIVSHRLSSGIVTDLNNAYDALSHALNGDEFVQEKKENSPISF